MIGLRRLMAAKRGAVAAEFAIAFMPLAITFFSFTQEAQLYTAHLVFKHAALAAARAAITTKQPCNPGKEKDHKQDSDIRTAAMDAVVNGAWLGHFGQIQATSNYSGGEQYGPVTTNVTAKYHCTVPLGKTIVCGGFLSQVNMKETLTMPHQGARYENAGGCN